jgi:hypothetical protein
MTEDVPPDPPRLPDELRPALTAAWCRILSRRHGGAPVRVVRDSGAQPAPAPDDDGDGD